MLSMLPTAARAAPGAASLTLSPATGPPTTRTTATGTGFGAAEVVDIRFDTKLIATAQANASGVFSTKVKVPKTAFPGTHQIKAKGETSGTLATATFTVRTDWTKFHFDVANSGLNPYENVLSSSNVSGLVQAWAAKVGPTGSNVFGSMAVVAGLVYVGVGGPGNGYAYLDAFDASSGVLVWQQSIPGGAFTSSVTVAKGTLFVGLGDHTLRAYSATTGDPLWSFPGAAAMGTPLILGLAVHVSDALGNLYNLNARTGAQIWKVSNLGILLATPAVSGGLIYTADESGVVYAFDATTGTPVWTATLGGGGYTSSPAVVDGILYIGATDNNLYALDASTGSILWIGVTSGSVDSSPAVANGLVYVGSEDGSLHTFDSKTGDAVWATPTGGTIVAASPSVANGVVYMGSESQQFFALDASTGTILWSVAVGGIVNNSSAIADGVLYVAPVADQLYAYHLP